jgi:hypothetical protein
MELVNKGTGAGGANTNLNGKKFESKTDNKIELLTEGFEELKLEITKKNNNELNDTCNEKKTENENKKNEKKTKNKKKKFTYFLSKTFDDKKIIFMTQNTFKNYMKEKYDIDLFRYPDEAYIIEYNDGRNIIKILEKKEQHVEGSVETKLWSGASLKREYELVLGDKFEVHYGFCVNDFLQKKIISDLPKYKILNIILEENNIKVLFGDDEDYFNNLKKWYSMQ